jgi:hypothetical protein
MKPLLSLIAFFYLTAFASAACICEKGSENGNGYQECDNYGEKCHMVYEQRATYTALFLMNDKEYVLDQFSERSKCVQFLKTAPECK